jgi:hypothetical protein
MRVLCACLLAACLTSGCEEPPNKEIDQAQGAIDAARAAGAEQYAGTEFTAATAAMTRATEAVAASDYRMALNHALESRTQARNAARAAAENRARARGEVERTIAEIAALLAQAEARFATAQRARVPRPAQQAARQTLAGINASVQKAGALLEAGDYAAAQAALQGVMDRTEKMLGSLTPATSGARGRSPGPRK